MQRVILLKRPTFLLYVGVESFRCAISSNVYKLHFPVSLKNPFQDKRNKTVAVLSFLTFCLTSIMKKVTMMLLRPLFHTGKGRSPPTLQVPARGGGRATPPRCRLQAQRDRPERGAGHGTDTVPQPRGYNTAGISDKTVSSGCQ